VKSLAATTIICVLAWTPLSGGQEKRNATEPARDSGPSAVLQPAGPPPTPIHTGVKALVKGLGRDFVQLPSKENLFWAIGGGAGALAAHQADTYVQEHVAGNPTAEAFFAPGRVIGVVVPIGGSVGTYVWGRMRNQPKVSHVGSDLIQAQVVAQALTISLKYATRRERPDQSDATSFPSGHAASTFAFATALERHLGWRYAVPAFTAASYVAASRLPANRHWLSDVVFGATVGIIAGRTVTSREAQPYPITVTAIPGGALVLVVPRRFNR
jgi:PAP2 superfamily